MKRPPPSAPRDAPPGTIPLSGPLGWFAAALQVSSESLVPEEVTRLFGVEPTQSWTKGIPLLRPDGTTKRVPRFGRWSLGLTPSDTDEWDINEVINEILARLPRDDEVWHRVAQLGR